MNACRRGPGFWARAARPDLRDGAWPNRMPRAVGGERMDGIEELVRKLPPELQQEVVDFAQSLLQRRAKAARGRPRFEWAGALSDLGRQYSSVELQHKISAWRAGEE